MLESFRLLQTAGGFEREDQPSGQTDPQDALQKVEFSKKPIGLAERPWVSVVIGKNGVGKSRLLAGITDIFETLDRGKRRRRKGGYRVSRLAFVSDDHLCEIETDNAYRLSAKIDGRQCELGDLPLPTKVIALTTTPFDKFRISRSLSTMSGKEEYDVPERYVYLGLRDRSGRASPTAAIFRAIEGLFEASGSEAERRLRISEVFEFLDFKPHVVVRYEFSASNMQRLEQIIAGEPLENVLKPRSPGTSRRPLERMLEREPMLLDEIRSIGMEVLHHADRARTFSLRADFDSFSADHTFFKRVQILRRADLLRMRAAEVERVSDGAVLDLKLASSGELGIATGFLGLASVIEDGSLIFIDEPEISLHPEWQVRYIDLLLRTFGNYKGCHFVLATHSPLILSDITPEHSDVISLDPYRPEAKEAKDFAGKSFDYLLVAAFQVPSKNNLYLKQEVIKALRLAADGKSETDEFTNVMDGLVSLLPKFEEGSPVAKLIQELQTASEVSTGGS